MTEPFTVTIAPERGQVRILARCGPRDVLKAILGPVAESHPRAASTLLDWLALWHHRRLAVVLCADDQFDGSSLGLCDGLGHGFASLHYDVALAYRGRRPTRRPIHGLGDFRDLRQLSLLEVDR